MARFVKFEARGGYTVFVNPEYVKDVDNVQSEEGFVMVRLTNDSEETSDRWWIKGALEEVVAKLEGGGTDVNAG